MRAWTAREPVRQRAKVWLLAISAGTAAGLIGVAALLLAILVREGPILCGADSHICTDARPYVALLPFAGAARILVHLRRRPWTLRREAGFIDEVGQGISDATLGSLLIVVCTFFFRSGYRYRGFSYSRLVFVFDWAFALAALVGLAVCMKALLAALRRRGHNQRNVVVVGPPTQLARIRNLVHRFPEIGYCLIGEIEDGSNGNGEEPTVQLQAELLKIAREHRIDEVILVLSRIDRRQLSALVSAAEFGNVEIKAVPELFGLPPRKVQVSKMGPLPVLELLKDPLSGSRRVVKRTIDIIVAFLLLVVTAPLMLLVAIAVRLTSEGPTIFRQTRVGMDGRPFSFLKFRTMYVDQDPSIHQDFVSDLIAGNSTDSLDENGMFKLAKDPRVTPVGRFLRRFSLDELPQLLNVLRGEMSLVGPRPSMQFEVDMYEDWHRWRLEVRPGITGLWQVSGRSLISFEEMVRLDIEYIENWSPLRDLLIILRTIPALIRKETG